MVNALQNQVAELQRIAHELLYLGQDGSPIYTDHFGQLNKSVLQQANALFNSKGEDDIAEASICLALLMGYNATIYNPDDKEERIQTVLNRCWEILDRLPDSLLKVQLLTYCYGEVFEEELATDAHQIIESWGSRELTADEMEIVETLRSMEANPYETWEVE